MVRGCRHHGHRRRLWDVPPVTWLGSNGEERAVSAPGSVVSSQSNQSVILWRLVLATEIGAARDGTDPGLRLSVEVQIGVLFVGALKGEHRRESVAESVLVTRMNRLVEFRRADRLPEPA